MHFPANSCFGFMAFIPSHALTVLCHHSISDLLPGMVGVGLGALDLCFVHLQRRKGGCRAVKGSCPLSQLEILFGMIRDRGESAGCRVIEASVEDSRSSVYFH